MLIQEGFFCSILHWLSSSPLMKNFIKGKMEVKEGKNTCGWEEELQWSNLCITIVSNQFEKQFCILNLFFNISTKFLTICVLDHNK